MKFNIYGREVEIDAVLCEEYKTYLPGLKYPYIRGLLFTDGYSKEAVLKMSNDKLVALIEFLIRRDISQRKKIPAALNNAIQEGIFD